MNVAKVITDLYTAFSKTLDQERRCSYLIQAVGWLERVVGSLKERERQTPSIKFLPDGSEKFKDRADKCKARALGTTFVNEKEVSLRTALHYLEKIAEKLNPPRLSDYIPILEKNIHLGLSNPVVDPAAAFRSTGGPASQRTRTKMTPQDEMAKWRAGTSAKLACDILLAQASIYHSEAVQRLMAVSKSSNYDARIKIVAKILQGAGKLRVVKNRRTGDMYVRL